jgi:hypothetical protein
VAAKVCFSSKHGLSMNQCPRVPGHEVSHAMVELPSVPESYSGSFRETCLWPSFPEAFHVGECLTPTSYLRDHCMCAWIRPTRQIAMFPLHLS